MVPLREALSQISEIRQQMADAQVFRGYRSATTAFTALVAAGAAAAQARWVPDPARQMHAYLGLWCGAAMLSVVVVGVEMVVRCRRAGSPLQSQITRVVADQFVPSLVAGGLLTFVIAKFAPDCFWALPGLWAVLFSLGVFASRRFLPRSITLVAGYYLLAGLCCLTLDRATAALSPWTMGLLFGAGQLLTAAVLYWSLERRHGHAE
jgi:hypothetical protein